MNDPLGPLCSIGELARRTGLTVKAIRFYSDRGIVPPTGRSPAGYRLFGADALARLDLVRTLRELGVGLADIRKVVARELSLSEVAAAHADALAVQIRTLRLRHAVLTAVARRDSSPEEMDLMHRLARLSADERRRLIDDFLDSVFAGSAGSGAFVGIRRSFTPELPDNPEPEQITAWVELAELSQDGEFRAVVRRLVEHLEAEQAGARGGGPRPGLVPAVRELVGPVLAAGIEPGDGAAAPVVEALLAHDVHVLTRLEAVNDPRRERYTELLAVINGWPAPESLAPVLDWAVEALRVRG
ncbi:MerR family transcriptional regulator [Streptomyces sp. Ag82_O1-15]|uniref:MerR family transcriptional regulator n=1 Tax=Streptomyces sp. Ag82_O1-15 TaxID=1938855 RepID=UPI000BB120EF|nr:MerR family transcriptional regulator [Streptomyces sp. Ag82_O1-15]